MVKQIKWLALSFGCCSLTSYSQEVQINRIELQGGDVIVSYELQDDNTDRRYSLHLYASRDNYIQPLEFVKGDIGIDIAVGGNKKVTWHASSGFLHNPKKSPTFFLISLYSGK